MSRRKADDTDRLPRIAIVKPDRCKPKKCSLECKRYCPVVRQGSKTAGKLCVEVAHEDKLSFISEELCIGCGICVKVLFSCCFDHTLSLLI